MMTRHSVRLILAGLLVAGGARAPAAQDRQADPRALQVMREVYEHRESWGPDFPGFEAAVTVRHRGREEKGTVRVGRDLSVTSTLPPGEPARWAVDSLRSIVSHRRAARFEEADGRLPLTLGPEDRHPAGRLVHLNDSMNSTYRVRDAQIFQINRTAGPRLRFSIDIIENLKTEEGRYLPRVFCVSYFQSSGGALERTETYWDGYRKTGGYQLPEFRRQVTAEDGGTEVMSLLLESHRLLP